MPTLPPQSPLKPGQSEALRALLDRFPYKKLFPAKELPFSGLTDAKAWLSSQGYSYGPTERLEPIGVLRGPGTVPSWKDMTNVERFALDGVIVIEDNDLGFRKGPALVRLRMKPVGQRTRTDLRAVALPECA